MIKVWYDPEGDFLEVIFKKKSGYLRETSNDQVMKRVDRRGNILGFSIMNVSKIQKKPIDMALVA